MLIFSDKNQRHLSFAELVKWILPFCLNIHTLKLNFIDDFANDLHNEIARLNQLKDLDISTCENIDLKEVTRVAYRTKTTLITTS